MSENPGDHRELFNRLISLRPISVDICGAGGPMADHLPKVAIAAILLYTGFSIIVVAGVGLGPIKFTGDLIYISRRLA